MNSYHTLLAWYLANEQKGEAVMLEHSDLEVDALEETANQVERARDVHQHLLVRVLLR